MRPYQKAALEIRETYEDWSQIVEPGCGLKTIDFAVKFGFEIAEEDAALVDEWRNKNFTVPENCDLVWEGDELIDGSDRPFGAFDARIHQCKEEASYQASEAIIWMNSHIGPELAILGCWLLEDPDSGLWLYPNKVRPMVD